MKLSLLRPAAIGAAVLAASTTLIPIRAQDSPRTEPKSTPGEGLRKFLEGFGSTLDDDQRQQLDRHLEDFQKSLKDTPGQARESKGEDRDEDATPKRRGRIEAVPDENQPPPRAQRQNRRQPANPNDQMRKQLEQMLPGADLDQFLSLIHISEPTRPY